MAGRKVFEKGYNFWVKSVPKCHQASGKIVDENSEPGRVTWESDDESLQTFEQMIQQKARGADTSLLTVMVYLKKVVIDGQMEFPFGLSTMDIAVADDLTAKLYPPMNDRPKKNVGSTGKAVLVDMIETIQGKLNIDYKPGQRLYRGLKNLKEEIDEVDEIAQPINNFSKKDLAKMVDQANKLNDDQKAQLLQLVHDNVSRDVGEEINFSEYDDKTLLIIQKFLNNVTPGGRRQILSTSLPELRRRSAQTTKNTKKNIQAIVDELARMDGRIVESDHQLSPHADAYNFSEASIRAAAKASIKESEEDSDEDTVSSSEEDDDEDDQPVQQRPMLLTPEMIEEACEKDKKQQEFERRLALDQRDVELQRWASDLQAQQDAFLVREKDLAQQEKEIRKLREDLNRQSRELLKEKEIYRNKRKRDRSKIEQTLSLTENEDIGDDFEAAWNNASPKRHKR